MAELLQLSDNELARPARSAVLVRKRDPYDSRAFIYPAWENVRRYILHGRARKEGAHTKWLEEKSKAARVQRRRAELEMAIKKGKLVSLEEAVAEFTPKCLAIRHTLECLLERGVSQAIVDEVLSILGPVGDSSSNGDRIGLARRAR
jgi:phage terminase Nu1 subunit (DNA packaging protein)